MAESGTAAGGTAEDGTAAGRTTAGETGAGPAGSGSRGVASPGYRWYVAVQAVSIIGTMMSYTALFWLALNVGGRTGLPVVVAAQSLPMLVLSRRAGSIVSRRPAAQVVLVTQALLAAASLAIGIPLLAGWMTIWYLAAAGAAAGCVQAVDLPARQEFMLDLLGRAELRRGTSLYATVTSLAKVAGPGIAGLIIAATGETAVFFADAASYLGVIAVLAVLAARTQAAEASGPASAGGTGSAGG